jgi:hypothetical protein
VPDEANVSPFVRCGPQSIPLDSLGGDWMRRVKVFEMSIAGEELPSPWGFDDYVGSLELRDIVANGLIASGADLRHFPDVEAADQLLERITVDERDFREWFPEKSGWWWSRVPVAGLARQEFERFRRQP